MGDYGIFYLIFYAVVYVWSGVVLHMWDSLTGGLRPTPALQDKLAAAAEVYRDLLSSVRREWRGAGGGRSQHTPAGTEPCVRHASSYTLTPCHVRCPAPPPQISSIEDADKKMAELAQQGKIDPAFLQITAKVGRGCADYTHLLACSRV
jgi:hypothetical protein